MKANKKNLLIYLKASIDSCHAVARIYKEKNDEATASKYIGEASALRDIVYCLENDEYFEKQFKIMTEDK